MKRLLGGNAAPTLTGILPDYFPAGIACKLIRFEPNAEGECFLLYRILR